MACSDNNYSCGEKVYSTCVYDEGVLPSWSTLDDCKVQSEINEELYSEVSTLRTLTDISDRTSSCFTINTDSSGVVTIPTMMDSIIRELEALVCPDALSLKDDILISSWGLDYQCLLDSCSVPISKLSQLQQLLINKACEGSGSSECCSLESSRQAGNYTLEDIYIHGVINTGLTIGRGLNSILTNTAIGTSVLAANTTGLQNTALGYQTLKLNTSGSYNTVVGYQAMSISTTAAGNSAFGVSVLTSATTAAGNSAFGFEALYSLVSSSNNSAFGAGSLHNATTAANSTAIGYESLGGVVTGSSNIGIGYRAGYNISTGSNNLVIGTNSGLGLGTGSGCTIIGSNVSGLSSSLTNAIILAVGTGSIKAQYNDTKGTWNIPLPTFATNSLALAGGLTSSDLYKTSTGEVRIVI